MSFGGGSINQTEQRVLSLQVSQSAYGAVIPRVWGTVRLPANLLWYGDFKAIAHTENQGGGKGGGPEFSTTTYTYRAAFVLGLCSGPINGVPRLWADKEQYTLAQKGFTLKTGALGQATWSHLTANHPTEAIRYSGIAYVCASAFDLGRTTSPPNLTFEIQGERLQAGGDALPSEIITDLLTDPVEGLAWSSARLADLADYSTWCAAMGIQLSLATDSQRAARDWVTDVLKATMADAVWSGGKLKFVPYGDEPVGAWVPNTTPAYDIDEGDLLEAPRVTVRQRSQAVNRVTVEYCDRAQDYKTVPVTRDDISMVTQFGAKTETHTLHCITQKAVAEKVADFWRDRGLYIRADYELKLDERFVLLEPMDLVTLTFAPLGLDRVVLRVAEVEDAEDGKITVKAEEWPFGIAKPASIPSEGATGYIPDLNASPGNSSVPVVFEPPIALAGEPQIWMATSGGVDWGGCEVWISLDNATYERIGEIQAPARHGLLTSALPVAGDPDTTSSLAVDLSVSRGQLVSATQDARDLWQTACWIASGAGNELISYQTATLTGANAYALSSLRRGGYGTQTLAHGAGAKIVRLDEAVFKYSVPKSFIGRTIYIKLPAINRFGGGRQDLSAVSATAYAVVGAPLGGVAGLALERAWTGKQLAVKWLPYQGPAGAYTYRVEVWSGGIKRRTTDIGSAVRFEISQEQLKQDGCSRTVEIRVYAVSDTGVSSSPSVLGATNSAPAAPSIQLFDGGAALTVIASKATDDDYLETRFWLSQTPGINVSVATPTAILTMNQYTTGTIATGTWYVRAAHVDQFGADVINASAETSVVVSAVASGVPRVANASLITTAANQDPPGGDAYWAVWSIAHGTIWSWNKAGGYYLNNADLANGYYNLLSAVRGTFGYLSAISASLGNAQIDANGWLRTNGVTGYSGGTSGVFLGYDAGAYKARFGGVKGGGQGGAGWNGAAFEIWGPDGTAVLSAGAALTLSPLIDNEAVPFGQNAIANSDQRSTVTWVIGYTQPGTNIAFGPVYASAYWDTSSYALAGQTRNIVVKQSGDNGLGDTGTACDLYVDGNDRDFGMPVAPGERVCGSVYLQAARCNSRLILRWYAADGSGLPSTTSSLIDPPGGLANALSAYSRVSVIGTAPAGAVSVCLGVRKYNTLSGQADSFIWLAAPQLERISSGVTGPSPYMPGPPNSVRQIGYAGDLNATNGAPSGTLVGGVSADVVATAATNFNTSNDRNSAAVTAPTILSDGTAVDHTLQTDGSADISFEWSWGGTEGDIDGFLVYVYQAASSAAYTFGTTPAAETVYTVPASKRAFILFGSAADKYYTFGVRAYRSVDKDVAASGVIQSSIIKPSLAAENPYRPSANVAFTGNVTGTVNGIAATSVNVWSAISGSGKPADNATVGATIGTNLAGAFSQTSWDVVMPAALIGAAQIKSLYASTITGIKNVGSVVLNMDATGSQAILYKAGAVEIRADGTLLVRGDIEASSIKADAASIVSTLHLQGEAVTVPRSGQQVGSASAGNSAWVDVASVSVPITDVSATVVMASVRVDPDTSIAAGASVIGRARVVRRVSGYSDVQVVETQATSYRGYSAGTAAPLSRDVSPGSGTATYVLQVSTVSNTANFSQGAIVVIGSKK